MANWFPDEHEKESESPEHFLKENIHKSLHSLLTRAGQHALQYAPLPETFKKGIAEGAQQTAGSASRGIAGLFGGEGLHESELSHPESILQSLGRGAGVLSEGGLLAAPFALGAEGASAGVLPAYISRALGAGSSGALLDPGSLKHRLGEGLQYGATSLGLEALQPLAKMTKLLVGGFKPRAAADIILDKYKDLSHNISESFQGIAEEAGKRGVTKIPVKKNLFNEILKLGPKTTTYKEFVEKAKSGDYESLRKLQTELWKRANRLDKSGLGSEADVADRLREIREDINGSIEKTFKEKGHHDLAEKLNKARGDYKDLMETYHANPVLRKLVGPEEAVPKNFVEKLREDKNSMKRIVERHPELKKHLKFQGYVEKLKKITHTIPYIEGLRIAEKYLNGENG